MQGVLTAEQKTKLRNAKEELKEMRAESLAEEITHLGALDLTDNEVAQIAAIRKEFRPQIEKNLQELEGLLTPDQKKARQDALQAGKGGRFVREALKLTDAAKEKVQAVGRKVGGLCREEMERIRDLLHAGQKKQLQEVKAEAREHVRDRQAYRIATLKDLNLTGEQKARIADIRKEFGPRVHEAGNRLRATIREEVEAILAVVKG